MLQNFFGYDWEVSNKRTWTSEIHKKSPRNKNVLGLSSFQYNFLNK